MKNALFLAQAVALILVSSLPVWGADVFYRGADLSYVNEVDDNGGVYREAGVAVDAFDLFARKGANLVRVRLWVDATWTKYSNLADVIRTLQRAKDHGMAGQLVFHYSDTWADPSAQKIPERWKKLTDAQLVEAVHDYTRDTLEALASAGVLPAQVSIGNETNPGLLKRAGESNQWDRDVALFEAGLKAVREVATAHQVSIQTMLHVAQPQNADWWFTQAREHGLTDFDLIALSYYPQWSPVTVEQCGQAVAALTAKFGKPVLIVETGVPFTGERVLDTANNMLTRPAEGYRMGAQGQRDFLVDLTRALAQNGGLGLIYWEPAWLSTSARTLWGQGSHWENATFFDFRNDNEALPAFDFYSVSLE